MADKDKPADTTGEALWFLFKVVLVAFLAWIVTGGPGRFKDQKILPARSATSTISSTTRENRNSSLLPGSQKPASLPLSSGAATDPTSSPYRDKINVSLGNAKSEKDPNREYLILSAPSSNKEDVVISGWTLKNENDKQYDYQIARYGKIVARSEKVAIPKGVRLFATTTQYNQKPIALSPGQRAYVTTGSPPTKFPFMVNTSFLTNKCMGYIAKWTPLVPSLPSTCLSYKDFPAVDWLDEECNRFVKRVSGCATPEYSSIPQLQDMAYNCRYYVLKNLNYNSCIYIYRNDKDFYGKDWRVFLRYREELWPAQNNSVTLYDQNGKIVDRVEY